MGKALHELRAELFFGDVAEALAAIPSALRNDVPTHFDVKTRALQNRPQAQAIVIRVNGEWRGVPLHDSRLKLPKPTEDLDLHDFSLLNVHDTLATVIDETGRTISVWLLLPSLPKVDVAIAESLRKRTYKPATYDGSPVASSILQETTFSSN